MGVYTKTGDKGETGLYTGERVKKSSLRVEAYGTVDELDSALAMARAFCRKEEIRQKIFALQKLLPLLMADLASMGQEPMIKKEHVDHLEHGMDEMEAALPPFWGPDPMSVFMTVSSLSAKFAPADSSSVTKAAPQPLANSSCPII